MKATLKAADLARELALVVGAVDGGSTSIAILRNIHLRTHGKALTLSGTDMSVTARSSLLADVAGKGEAVAPAAQLQALIRTFDGMVTLEAEPGAWLSVESEGSQSKLATLKPEDYPALPDRPAKPTLELPGGALLSICKRVQFALERTDSTYSTDFMQLKVESERMLAVATDGRRLVVAAAPAPGQPDVQYLLPKRLVQLLLSSDARLLGPLAVGESGNHIVVWTEELTLSCLKPTAEHFPSYDKVTTLKTSLGAVTLPVAPLKKALKRVAVLAGGVEGSPVATIQLSDAGVTLEGKSAERGQGRETIAATVAPTLAGKTAFQIRYLTEFLATLDDDQVAMAYSADGEDAMHFWPAGDPSGPKGDHHYVLMPVRQ